MNMPKKFWIFMKNQNSHFIFTFFLLFFSCNAWALFEKVFSSKNEVIINNNISLKIESSFPSGCFDDLGLVSRVDCFPSNKLFLFYEGKEFNYSNIVKYWKNTFVYFVKISPKGYFDDLDNDGNYEVALYPMIAGNNPITDAYVYSVVGNKIVHYGMGKFHFEWGPYVKKIIKGQWIEPHP